MNGIAGIHVQISGQTSLFYVIARGDGKDAAKSAGPSGANPTGYQTTLNTSQ